MTYRILLAVLLTCLGAASFRVRAQQDKSQADKPAQPAAEKPSNKLTVPGEFSLTAPEGYVWNKAGEPTTGPQKTVMFLATKPDATGRIFIAAMAGKATTDAKRTAMLKGFYNGTIGNLQKLGLTDAKTTPPDLKPPIPDRPTFSLTAKTADGQPFLLRGLVIFGQKNSYHIQAAANSDADLDTLVKCLDSLKE